MSRKQPNKPGRSDRTAERPAALQPLDRGQSPIHVSRGEAIRPDIGGPIPLWPGLLVTAICAAAFFGCGVGRYGLRVSSYFHHNLTAYAWLHGRFHVTQEEIKRVYVMRELSARGVAYDHNAPWLELGARFYKLIADPMRAAGYSQEQIQMMVERQLGRAFHDWVHLGDRYYAYWPPVPVLMMLPFVAMFGPDFSDVLVGNLLGTLSVWFLYLALRALKPYWPDLTPAGCAALAILYGLGTCHFYQATIGQVWYITQLSAALFLIISIWFGALGMRRPVWFLPAAAALGLGFLARNTTILAAPFFAVALWIAVRDGADWLKRYIGWAVACNLILAAAVGAQLGFNQARFGDPMDFGQGHLADAGGNPKFVEEFKRYGRFHPHFLAKNLNHYFFNLRLRNNHPKVPGWTFDPYGNSLFAVSPAMLYLFLAWRQKRRDLIVMTLAGLIPGTAALMLFHGTGYYHFGQRYLLDTMPFFVLLAGFGMRGRLSFVSAPLIGLSILINAWGTYRFGLEQPP